MSARALVIVADDLTGACDTAGMVAAAGRPVRVDLGPGGDRDAWVRAVDLDSRAGDAQRAVVRTVAAIRDATAAGAEVYLKIDSTLRGHIVQVVDAASAAFLADRPGGRVVVCPAFPARGRTVTARRLLVEGVARESAVLEAVARLPGVEVPDAASDADLAAIVAASADQPVLWVGSAGMAPHVAGRGAGALAPSPTIPRVHSVAVVVGTEQAAAIAGARDLRRRADARIEVVDGDPRVRAMIDRAEAAASRHDGIVVTGGYTARRLLDRLGVASLLVGGEVEPGIPWSTTLDGGRAFVTKAGGFGDRGTLGRAVDRLLGPA